MATLPDFLSTERLLLREPLQADAAVVFERYCQDPDVARYTVWRPHGALEQTEAFVAECREEWAQGQCRGYMLVPKGETAPIGMVEARLKEAVVEVGYVLARPWWGQGLMPEAVRALVTAAFLIPGIDRAEGSCDVDNRASARTLEKAGFQYAARLERYMVHPNLSLEPRDCLLYVRNR